MFRKIDKDEDGKISEAELNAHFEKNGGSVPDGLMAKEDKDKDGYIQWSGKPQRASLFQSVYQSSDGYHEIPPSPPLVFLLHS